MKRYFGIAIILTFLSIPSFAAKNEQTVTFSNAVTVGSAKLPAGDYKVTWTGTSPNVQVTLVQKDARHPATVTVPAKLVDQKNDRTAFTTGCDNGVNKLEQLQLKNENLVFTNAPASGQ